MASVFPAATELHLPNVGLGIQCFALKLWLSSHVHALTGLVSLYLKCGDMETSEILFEQINRPI